MYLWHTTKSSTNLVILKFPRKSIQPSDKADRFILSTIETHSLIFAMSKNNISVKRWLSRQTIEKWYMAFCLIYKFLFLVQFITAPFVLLVIELWVVVHCMIELIDLIKYQTVFELDESSYHFLIPFELMSISLHCWIVCLWPSVFCVNIFYG